MCACVAVSLAGFAWLAWGLNCALVIRFLRYCDRYRQRVRTGPGQMPPAAVVLSLRGADPTLRSCLEGLAAQDYPDFCVQIVVDSDQDPAYGVVQEFLAETDSDRLECHTRQEFYSTCSLKCSSLIQAVQNIDPRYEYVAFIDCDVVPHASWLRELVAPLSDPQVGASTGNRWYSRPSGALAGWGLTAWYALMVAAMQHFQIAWGGSLAIRRELLEELGIPERWRHSLNDDVLLGQIVVSHGLRLEFIPDLLMVNHGQTDLQGLVRFITRQLLHVRVGHMRTLPINLLGAVTTFSGAALAAHGAISGLRGEVGAMAIALGGLAGYLLGMAGLYYLLEGEATRSLQRRGWAFTRLGWRAWLAVPVASSAHLAGLVQASTARRVSWRGIQYSFVDRQRVTLDQYEPSPMLIEATARP